MNLALGNHDPCPLPGTTTIPKSAVYIAVGEPFQVDDVMETVFGADGVWSQFAMKGAKPRWVASDDPRLTAAVVGRFTGIEVRSIELPPTTLPAPAAPLTATDVRSLVEEILAEEKGTP